jgi:hypothetical protein
VAEAHSRTSEEKIKEHDVFMAIGLAETNGYPPGSILANEGFLPLTVV